VHWLCRALVDRLNRVDVDEIATRMKSDAATKTERSFQTLPRSNRQERSKRAHHIMQGRPVLEAMFAPKSVALIGATESSGSVGRALMENLHSFSSAVYPVNPKRATLFGVKAFAKIGDVPGDVDLAVIATPAVTVPEIVGECARANVKGAVIISAGFKECGPGGAELEKQILARRGKMRIIGPNCVGVMFPHVGLNATFAKPLALPGNIGFISQSGALCTAILDWSRAAHLGFSAFISIGSMLDVNWGDLIYHLGDDPGTRSILLYMESVGDARSFLSAAREVALTKPIIVIKVGRTEAAAKAAASHTGSLTGSDAVLDAAFRRVGVLRVDTIAELFNIAELLGKQPGEGARSGAAGEGRVGARGSDVSDQQRGQLGFRVPYVPVSKLQSRSS
jgi:acetyltransferase